MGVAERPALAIAAAAALILLAPSPIETCLLSLVHGLVEGPAVSVDVQRCLAAQHAQQGRQRAAPAAPA